MAQNSILLFTLSWAWPNSFSFCFHIELHKGYYHNLSFDTRKKRENVFGSFDAGKWSYNTRFKIRLEPLA